MRSKKMKKILVLLKLTIFVVSLAACESTPLPQGTATNVLISSTPTQATTPTTFEPTHVPDAHAFATLLTAKTCLNNTPGEAECKDCCDSLDADGETRKTCRDACPGHDFSQNTDFVTFEALSVLGPNGNYSACTSLNSEQACKACCDGSSDLQSGDRRFCRDDCVKSTKEGKQPGADSGEKISELILVDGSYEFAEGPAADQHGNVYFSDFNAGKIYKWSSDGSVVVFLDGLNKPNGLAFDGNGMLIACEGGSGRLISIDPRGQITVLADQYNQIRFNEPNDLWIDPQGGIYFTDPAYQSPVVQDSEHVYYLTQDRSQVMRVIDDMVRPNGIVGTADGKTLYVTDHGAGQTYSYQINTDGTVNNKRLFVSVGSDGMTIDTQGNLYLTTPNQVQVYDAAGVHIQDFLTQENPTNVTFGGRDHRTLFITARTAVYIIQMQVGDE
jgi:gluconolactonase